MNCARGCVRRLRKSTPMDESLSQCIERLSALPPRKRLEAFHAIEDLQFRRRVARELPPQVYSEILSESLLENLNRNVLKDVARRNPGQAALTLHPPPKPPTP